MAKKLMNTEETLAATFEQFCEARDRAKTAEAERDETREKLANAKSDLIAACDEADQARQQVGRLIAALSLFVPTENCPICGPMCEGMAHGPGCPIAALAATEEKADE
jgi:chromosome segregation ATPase